MSLIIPPGFGLAAFRFSGAIGTPEFVTTLGVDLTGAGGSFTEAADRLFRAYRDEITPTMTSTLILDKVTLSVGQDGGGGSVDSTIAPIQGGRSGSVEAIAMAPVIRKVTNTLGRSGRGRMFPPGMFGATEVGSSGQITAARITTLQTAFDDLFDSLAGTDDPAGPFAMPPVLLHGPTGPIVPTPIVAFTVADIVGWIRGRIR